ncbi:MAG: phosphodiester glycosidase family protein [Clostridiaceae bacterium]|nr:phosphodiester glycosidase family protein [Clostridiaceae bacterium]
MKKVILTAGIIGIILFSAAFLFIPKEKKDEIKLKHEDKGREIEEIPNPVIYKQFDEVINGNIQRINMLEVNVQDSRIKLLPVLSQDSIFGFETTSSMAARKEAVAAINGGFFYPYGQPSGLVVIDGKLLSTARDSSARPAFVVNGNREFHISNVSVQVIVKIENISFYIDGINREPGNDEIIVFTPDYGLTTRINGRTSLNVVAEDNVVSHIVSSDEEVSIPRAGIVIVATGERISALKEWSGYMGKEVNIYYTTIPSFNGVSQAMEGGFWVVKDGRVVIKEREVWVGLTTNREPRSVIGINEEGKAILLTVDGRQPGYSIGLTGDELARYLLSLGINNAIMLDGGASTTMVWDGRIVNRPSYRGIERMVGGAIVVQFDK